MVQDNCMVLMKIIATSFKKKIKKGNPKYQLSIFFHKISVQLQLRDDNYKIQ